LGYPDTELSLLFVDDAEMSRLNGEFRGVPEPTDVLSFPMWEGEFPDISPDLLGDVVISVPTAEDLARRHGASLDAILDLLLVHGILHLLGFDHDRLERARQMDRKTLELLDRLGHSQQSFAWFSTTDQLSHT